MQLERAISDIVRDVGDRDVLEHVVAGSGGTLTTAQAWAVGQTHLYTSARGRTDLPATARAHRLPHEVLQPVFADLIQAGYTRLDRDTVPLTKIGQVQVERIELALRQWLDAHVT